MTVRSQANSIPKAVSLPITWSRCAAACTAFIMCAAWPAALWAQKTEEAEEAGKSYTLGYALVALGIGLGLMLVLRPVGRTTEIKLPKSE